MTSEGASWGDGEYDAAEGIHTEHSDQQVDTIDQDPRDSGEEAENGAEGDDTNADEDGDDEEEEEEVRDGEGGEDEEDDDGDGGDYDPESLTVDTPHVPDTGASTPSQRPTSKPKMSGGFLVEASDDEDEEDTPQPSAGAQPDQSIALPAGNPNGASASPTPNVPSNIASAPLGIDPVVMLEARVKEDPRGDMDAWLNLLAEYRRRNRLDDARSTYNRFFDVFPQAVSASHANF